MLVHLEWFFVLPASLGSWQSGMNRNGVEPCRPAHLVVISSSARRAAVIIASVHPLPRLHPAPPPPKDTGALIS
jgi:hypothetical protein